MLALRLLTRFVIYFFVMEQVYLTSINQTTNENTKWSDVRKWHKKQTKRWNEAVKKGLVKEKKKDDMEASHEVPEVSDGDVTCTGAAAPKQQSKNARRLLLSMSV